ncbi:MAG TPA: GrpB family protein [Armatimonadota bacterium]|nr:GrpB family protein [Armatimonadota bacterium]
MSDILGLKRGTVKLVPHNPKWAKLFEQEKQLLVGTFGETIFAMEHIGSTAIPGIPAKPILDMNIGVESLEIAKEMKDKFVELGYEHRPFVPGQSLEGLQAQELYVRGPETKRTHFAHVTVYGSDFWNNALLFRDYLRSHPGRAQEYDDLKQKLAQQYGNDRGSYSKGKEQFVLQTLEMARRSCKTGETVI